MINHPYRSKTAGLLLSFWLTDLILASLPLTATSTLAAPIEPSQALREAVTVDGIRVHLNKLQEIANANQATRVASSPGYQASADYMTAMMSAAGYQVTRQPFTFTFPSFAQLQQLTPTPKTYRPAAEVGLFTFSPLGTVTGQLQAVDVVIPVPQGVER